MFGSPPKAEIESRLGFHNYKTSLRAQSQWLLALVWIILRIATSTRLLMALGTILSGERRDRRNQQLGVKSESKYQTLNVNKFRMH